MTNEEVNELVAHLETVIDRLRALCAPQTDPDDLPDRGMNDLIPAADGADIARRAKPTMNAWCREHPVDAGGFAVKIGERWFVSKSRLVRHLKKAKSSGSSD